MTVTGHPYQRFSAVLSYVFMVAVFAMVVWLLVLKVDGRAAARNKAVIAQLRNGCNQTQLRNVYIRTTARTPERRRLSRAYFQIIDCHATYRPGLGVSARTVYLPGDLQRCWHRLTTALYWRSHPVTTEVRKVRVLCRGRTSS